MTDNERTWHADFLADAIGARIAQIRTMTDAEIAGFGWDRVDPGATVLIAFDNGVVWIPMMDPEGNGPGFVEVGGA